MILLLKSFVLMLYCYFCLLFYLIYSYYWGIVLVFSLYFVVVFLWVGMYLSLSYVLCSYLDSWSRKYVVDCSYLFSIFCVWYASFIIIFDGLTHFGVCFIFLLISLFSVSPLVVDLFEYNVVLLCLLICVVYGFSLFCRTAIFYLL